MIYFKAETSSKCCCGISSRLTAAAADNTMICVSLSPPEGEAFLSGYGQFVPLHAGLMLLFSPPSGFHHRLPQRDLRDMPMAI